MTGSGYQELERTLEALLGLFSKTKQKLNRFERARRDRLAGILGEVSRRRQQREQSQATLVSDSAP